MPESNVFPSYSPIADVYELTDATLAHRDNQWFLFLAGQRAHDPSVHLFSATLPPHAPLAPTGWTITPSAEDPTRAALLAPNSLSQVWDGPGGRHCPAYVKGWDPHRRAFVERIYYAGSAADLWGPYAIGYLEWDGSAWRDQPAPVFLPTEPWERGSVYEPNLLFHDGKWKLWYVAGANQDDYLVHGYSESEDGRTHWSPHKLFAPPELRLFDFAVLERPSGFEAVFSRVWVKPTPPPPETGLWWTRCDSPSSNFSDWSEPVQILTANTADWHTAPWRPAFRYSESDPSQLLVFFDALRHTGEPGPFPFAFLLGCLQTPAPTPPR